MLDEYFDAVRVVRIFGCKLSSNYIKRQFPSAEIHTLIIPAVGVLGLLKAHLSILREAKKKRFSSVLILCADTMFSSDFNYRGPKVFETLRTIDWSIFYGGFDPALSVCYQDYRYSLKYLTERDDLQAANCIAFNRKAIDICAKYLETTLKLAPEIRHIDDTYTLMRRELPTLNALAAIPPLTIPATPRLPAALQSQSAAAEPVQQNQPPQPSIWR